MVLAWLMCLPAFSQSSTRAVVDAWFNSQQRTNAAGQLEYFHYKWNDVSNSGFSLFGQSSTASAWPRIRFTTRRPWPI